MYKSLSLVWGQTQPCMELCDVEGAFLKVSPWSMVLEVETIAGPE